MADMVLMRRCRASQAKQARVRIEYRSSLCGAIDSVRGWPHPGQRSRSTVCQAIAAA